MNRYKVSVIVPVYNVEKYIEKSLVSICTQEFNDYEIIIVNDGTKDESMRIVNKVLSNYNIPFTIINQINLGLPSARNAGLKVATGEFVCFIDSDDIIDRNYLKKLYNFAKNSNQKVCFCDFENVFENKREGTVTTKGANKIVIREELLTNFLKRKYKIHCCALLINRKMLIDKSIFFNEKLRYGEDNNFMWRLFPTIDTIGYVGEPLYKYLHRENSLMTNQNINNFLVMKDILIKTSNDLKIKYIKDIEIFEHLPGRILLGSLRSFARQSNYETFKHLLNDIYCEQYIKKLLNFPDIRVILLSIIFFTNKRLFFYMIRL